MLLLAVCPGAVCASRSSCSPCGLAEEIWLGNAWSDQVSKSCFCHLFPAGSKGKASPYHASFSPLLLTVGTGTENYRGWLNSQRKGNLSLLTGCPEALKESAGVQCSEVDCTSLVRKRLRSACLNRGRGLCWLVGPVSRAITPHTLPTLGEIGSEVIREEKWPHRSKWPETTIH